ncbi:MAG: hypothetical protein OXG85_17115 [Chloroflexi bacterium]|nr:hypothetical protein [Chloroflexota bacterium]
MRTIDVLQSQSNRHQCLRLLMLLIIVATLPFYALAIIIIGSAPVEAPPLHMTQTATKAPSFTPLGAGQSAAPTFTPLARPLASVTPFSRLPATPAQFVPPTPLPAQTIVTPIVVSPTPILIADSPTLIAVATVGESDADIDGIADADDSCPLEFGFADNDGCPYPDDPDLDGFRGAADACPFEFAPRSRRGCRDFDDDGLDTAEDDCPRFAGPASNRGCPLQAVAGG